jgi:hypothetical protein
MLAVPEYVSRMYGVHLEGNELWWSAVGGTQSEYARQWRGNAYTLRRDGDRAEGSINGISAWTGEAGFRVVTDIRGKTITKINIT